MINIPCQRFGRLLALACRPQTTAGKVFSFLFPRVHDANQSTRGIFSRFQYSPVLSHAFNHANIRAWSGEHDVQRIQAPGARDDA